MRCRYRRYGKRTNQIVWIFDVLVFAHGPQIMVAPRRRMGYTLNIYYAQDIATYLQYRQQVWIPHTPKYILYIVASRPNYVYAYTIPKVAGYGPYGRP